MPTVIISQKVRPGQESAHREIQAAIGDLVRVQPGFAGIEVMEPVVGRQTEWIVVFRFCTDEALSRWLNLRERGALVEKLAVTLSEPPAMQVLADDDRAGRAISVVFSQHIRSGAEEAFRKWHKEIVTAQSLFPGYLGTESFPPTPGIQKEWVDIVRFDRVENLEAWMKSDVRAELIKRRPLVTEQVTERRIASGLEAWFTNARKKSALPPPRWKQGLAVLLALYPTAMILFTLFTPALQGWPAAFRVLLLNFLGVGALTFFMMPVATRVLSGWLAREQPHPGRDLLGTLLIFVILGTLAGLFYFVFQEKPPLHP